MPITLEKLPFDILFYVACSLDFDDIIHLGRTCRQLRLLLNENTLCRKVIEAHAPHSREAQSAQIQRTTYSEALESIYSRRDAFSNAYPFSARILGHGTAFIYRQGVLCVLHGSVIRISDIYARSELCEIDLSFLSGPNSASGPSCEPLISLLHFSDGIISIHCKNRVSWPRNRIIAFRTDPALPANQREITSIQLESSSKLFVRHTSSSLYFGTHTGVSSDGHHEWEIQGVSLDNGSFQTQRPIQLVDFFGGDIGSTVAFEIHDGYFYAVSNQTSFDVEELDWTSFYHCIRFPLDDPHPNVEANKRVYRRQHAEGPIHDSWTDLSIQIDEQTNSPLIVESRREWQKSSSHKMRAFYISEFNTNSTTPSTGNSPDSGLRDEPMLPLDDPFSNLVDSTNHPHWAPTQPRYSWNVHPEVLPNTETCRSFLLARTKVRAYNYSCHSFIDLVEDDGCCGVSSSNSCLRIRIGSRRLAPFHWESLGKAESSKSRQVHPPFTDDDVSYSHSTIKMWPPVGALCPCSLRLHKILNPPFNSGTISNRKITGVVDERSLVYMVKPGRTYAPEDDALGVIILIDFSRGPSPAMSADDVINVAEDQWHWTPGYHAYCQTGDCR
ncbi:hypothetical protein K491DRAFT_679541 [Lophiostoma macrostomum CBS 122681]|uniref:F-box domain-containing protein n=1 Tax=Lophiostoma macrostomum CBS 122681 TaxID=1314788 RepID=A0A6A6T6R2_9PLEO|nr:hypothetical protein K491DRAFT_679541 [Lophiostoma macrostomum CBS 122681]